MGAAAVPIMIFTTVASTAISISQSRQQSALAAAQGQAQTEALQRQGEAEMNQITAQSKEEEIARLRLMRSTISQNVIRAVAGGTTLEGSPASMIESNIEEAREDISTIQLNREAALKGIEYGVAAQSDAIAEVGAMEQAAIKTQIAGQVVGGIGGVAGASQGLSKSGQVTGVEG